MVKTQTKAGRMIVIFLAVVCLSILPVLSYSSTFNIGRLSAEGNSSNYTLTLFDEVPTGFHEANSSNYTLTFEAFDYEANPNIETEAEEEEDDDSGSSSRSSGSSSSFSSWPTSPSSETESVAKDVSYGLLVSSKNKTILVENKNKEIVLEKVEIKLIDNLTGEKKNLLIQIVQVGETKTRVESLSFFGYQYRMLEINHEDIQNEDIKSAKIDFHVLDTWLQEKKLTKEDVLLFRFSNGEWQELKTAYEDHNTTHHFYSALSPGLSSFMIGTREDVVEKIPDRITGNVVDEREEETNTQTENTPDNTQTDETETRGKNKLLEGELFGLKKAIAFLFISILLSVIIIGGTALAMKHKRLHPRHEQKIDSQETTPQEEPSQEQAAVKTKEPTQKKGVEETDFVDRLTGHIDAKAQEIAGQVDQVEEDINEEQSVINPRITTTSVRKDNQQKTTPQTNSSSEQKAPKELDFTGHEEEALAHYIKQVITAGYEKELYTKALLAKGWTKDQIDHCVAKVMNEHAQTPSRTQTK